MHIIVCLDDADGMMFNKRRQSSDRLVCCRILEKTAHSRLWMNAYSAKLFVGKEARINIDEAFLEKCPDGEWCFVETQDVSAWADKIESITVYRWNRRYPSDKKFPSVIFETGWHPVRREDFPGNSHETVTEEVYAR